MKRLTSASVLATMVLLLASIAASAQSPLTSNAQRALQWLQCAQQQPNGQIGNGGNPIARSSEVAFGLAAAGEDASAMKTGTVSLADYLKTAVSTDVGTNGVLLLARASQPHAGPTAAVIAQLQAAKGSNGEYGADLFSDALAILGLRGAKQAVGQDSVAFLKDHQQTDGGWSFDNAAQFGTDSNTTALVVQALISAGLADDDPSIARGFDYLQTVFGHGGFGDTPGAGPDPNSDELAIQAILAAGRQGNQTWASMLGQALSDLAVRQISSGVDAGAIASSFSKLFATTSAPATFLLRPLTMSGIGESRVSLLSCPPASTATPPPTSTATPPPTTPRLAQTGAAADARPLLAGLAFFLFGIGTLMRPQRRAPRR